MVTAGEGREEEAFPVIVGGMGSSSELECKQVYVPKHNSTVNDLTWATKGVVVFVLNGDAILVLQR